MFRGLAISSRALKGIAMLGLAVLVCCAGCAVRWERGDQWQAIGLCEVENRDDPAGGGASRFSAFGLVLDCHRPALVLGFYRSTQILPELIGPGPLAWDRAMKEGQPASRQSARFFYGSGPVMNDVPIAMRHTIVGAGCFHRPLAGGCLVGFRNDHEYDRLTTDDAYLRLNYSSDFFESQTWFQRK